MQLDRQLNLRTGVLVTFIFVCSLLLSSCLRNSTKNMRITTSPLVNQVSKENIKNHILALTQKGSRYTNEEKDYASKYIKNQLDSFGYEVRSIKTHDNLNLVAELRGSVNPDNIFVLAAHYDTVENSPGADDNASAVAGMLEIARLLAGTSQNATVQLVAFDNEEKGLVGSRLYVESLKKSGKDLIGMISLEMIAYTCKNCQTPFSDIKGCLNVQPEGITTGDFIAIVANTHSKHMINDFRNAAKKFVPALKLVSAEVTGNGNCFPNTRRSDHASFWDLDYPAIMLTDTTNFRNPNYHTITDTLNTLDMEFATKVVKATLATVIRATNTSRPQLPQ